MLATPLQALADSQLPAAQLGIAHGPKAACMHSREQLPGQYTINRQQHHSSIVQFKLLHS